MSTQVATMTLTDVLNRLIANWNVLYVKLHHYHWFVTGPNFFTLHQKFEELYDEAAGYIDQLAERLLAIHGKPVGTMKECLQQASIREANGGETAEQMVKTIADDFEMLIRDLKESMKVAESQHDEATADIFLAIHQSLEKHVWMLRSFLR